MSAGAIKFTDDELDDIHAVVGRTCSMFEAFRLFFNIKDKSTIDTLDVEDFAISFYTQYNARYGVHY